jgi:hypothetical protein
MKVRIAIKSGSTFQYCEGSVLESNFPRVLKELYSTDSFLSVRKFIAGGSFNVHGEVLKRVKSPVKSCSTWEGLTKDCVVLFFDTNINYLYFSPYSMYSNGVRQKTKISTKHSDSFNNALLCA